MSPLLLSAQTLGAVVIHYLPRGIILLYHRVAQLDHDPYAQALTPQLFASQMKVLADLWPVVSVSEGWRRVQQREAGCWVAVSFDDAYREVYEQAWPALQPGQGVTVFACTHQIDQEFWWDRLRDPSLQPALRRSPQPQVDEPNSGLAPRMSAEQLAWVAGRPGCEVGNHTHRHLSLAVLNADQQAAEIATARQILLEWTGQIPQGLAYPFGDFNASAKEQARRCCQWACGVGPGLVWKGADGYALPRHSVPHLGGKEFCLWLRGLGLT